MSIRTRTRRLFTVLVCSSVAVLGLACGGETAETTQPESDAPPAATEVATKTPATTAVTIDFETCNGFGVNEAASYLELPATEIEDNSAQQSWGKDCSYVRRGDLMREKAVSFTFTRAESVDQAALEMAQLADHASVAEDVLPGQKASHRVAGIGDEAIWVAASESLYIRVGDVTIIVSLPNDEDQQREVARAVLASSRQ